MCKYIELTFVSAPKKYNCIFDKESLTIKIIKSLKLNNNSGKASFVNGNLFCFWLNTNNDGVVKSIDFFYKDTLYNSNDTSVKVRLVELPDDIIPYKYKFEIVKDNVVIVSEIFVSIAYNNYLINITYDDSDLEEDEVLIDFIYYWDNILKPRSF